MKEMLDMLAGNSFVFGYSMPPAWFIACGLLLLAAVMRSASLTMIAGMMLFTLYFIPKMAGV